MWLHKKIGSIRRFNSDNSVSSSGRDPTFLSVFKTKKNPTKTDFRDITGNTLYESETDVTSSHRGCDFSVTVGDRTTRQNTDITNQYGWAQWCFNTRATQRERELAKYYQNNSSSAQTTYSKETRPRDKRLNTSIPKTTWRFRAPDCSRMITHMIPAHQRWCHLPPLASQESSLLLIIQYK